MTSVASAWCIFDLWYTENGDVYAFGKQGTGDKSQGVAVNSLNWNDPGRRTRTPDYYGTGWIPIRTHFAKFWKNAW